MKTLLLHCLVLSAATIAVWLTGAFGEFVWIDHVEIEQAGYRVTSWEDFRLVWTTSLDCYLERDSGTLEADGGYFRPVYAMLISLDWLLWGDQPFAFHLTNILVHTLVVVSLYFLGRQILPGQSGVVFAATLLFALHPFGVHSVTWISGRKDSLCALFSVLALLCFGKLLNEPVNGRSFIRNLALVIFAVVFLNIGLLCKELAIVTPAFATLWIWTVSNRASSQSEEVQSNLIQRKTGKTPIALLALFWVTSACAIVYRKILLGGIGLNIEYPADSLASNLAVSCKLICWYVVRILAPINPTIVDRFSIGDSTEMLARIAMIVLATGLVFLLIALARRKPAALLFCWFFIWILPATGLVPLRHLYAERYLYPASWGLLLATVLMLQVLCKRLVIPRSAVFGLTAIVAIWFSYLTINANQYWDSDRTLFTHSLNQDEFYAEGLAALTLIELENKNYQLSLEFGMRAIESGNDLKFRSYWSPFGVYTNTGLAAYYSGAFDQSQELLEKALTFRPNNLLSSFHLGLVAEAKGQSVEAIRHYEFALSIDPNHHASRVNLGHVFLFEQRFEECISILKPTVASEPENRMAQINLATAYLLTKDFSSAELHFEAAIALDANDPVNLAKLAWSEFELGKTAEGKSHVNTAKQLLPENPTVRFVEQKYLGN